MLSFEGGGSESHYVEASFWRRLWTCRQTEYWMNEWMNEYYKMVCSFWCMWICSTYFATSNGGNSFVYLLFDGFVMVYIFCPLGINNLWIIHVCALINICIISENVLWTNITVFNNKSVVLYVLYCCWVNPWRWSS